MSKKIYSIVAIFILLVACSGSSILSNESSLPENPEKIVIRWNDSGGMLPESESIYISADSCNYIMWRNGNELKVDFTVNHEEIMELYAVFKSNKFDKIKVIEEQEVYDRGGTSIDISLDNKYTNKSNSGMSFIDEKDWTAYATVEKAIFDFTFSRIENKKINTTINLSKKLIESELIITILVNGDYIYDSSKEAVKNTLDTLLYPGNNSFEINLFSKDSMNQYGSNAFLQFDKVVARITDSTKVISFDFVDGMVVVE